MREQIAADPYYQRCALSRWGGCDGRVQWHHVWIYAGRQINEIWAIEPACEHHHDVVNKDGTIKRAFERLSLARATAEDLAKYPRKAWEEIKKYLYAEQK